MPMGDESRRPGVSSSDSTTLFLLDRAVRRLPAYATPPGSGNSFEDERTRFRCHTHEVKSLGLAILAMAPALSASVPDGPPITTAGRPAQLDIRVAGARSVRVTLSPIG